MSSTTPSYLERVLHDSLAALPALAEGGNGQELQTLEYVDIAPQVSAKTRHEGRSADHDAQRRRTQDPILPDPDKPSAGVAYDSADNSPPSAVDSNTQVDEQPNRHNDRQPIARGTAEPTRQRPDAARRNARQPAVKPEDRKQGNDTSAASATHRPSIQSEKRLHHKTPSVETMLPTETPNPQVETGRDQTETKVSRRSMTASTVPTATLALPAAPDTRQGGSGAVMDSPGRRSAAADSRATRLPVATEIQNATPRLHIQRVSLTVSEGSASADGSDKRKRRHKTQATEQSTLTGVGDSSAFLRTL